MLLNPAEDRRFVTAVHHAGQQGIYLDRTSSGIYRFDGISYSAVQADDTLSGASVSAMFQVMTGRYGLEPSRDF